MNLFEIATGLSIDNETHFLYGTADPSSGVGVEASVSSLYFRNTATPEIWFKYLTGDTNWIKIADVTGANAEDEYQNLFLGKTIGNNLPDYTSENYVTDDETVVSAISSLDSQVKVNSDNIVALQSGMLWRPKVFIHTEDTDVNAAADDVALSTLLPLSDDDYLSLVVGDFSDGDYILSSGTTDRILIVYDDAGTLRVTTNTGSVDALAQSNLFIVDNDLVATGIDESNDTLYTYDGTNLVRVGEITWNTAANVLLSNTYTAIGGNPTAGDDIETAISKVDGNQDDILTAIGIPQGITNLGAWTGSGAQDILLSTESIKTAIQKVANEIGAAITGSAYISDQAVNLNLNALDTALNSLNTAVGLNTTHRSSDGTDHTYIDQDVRTTASPTFVDLTLSGTSIALGQVSLLTGATDPIGTGVTAVQGSVYFRRDTTNGKYGTYRKFGPSDTDWELMGTGSGGSSGGIVEEDVYRNLFGGTLAGDSLTSGNLENILLGYKAGQALDTGDYNVVVGTEALNAETTGSHNVVLGNKVLTTSVGANSNVGVGSSSLFSVTSGEGNVGVGRETGYGLTTGNYNLALGHYAFRSNTVGERNIALGPYAGYYETGSDKLFIDNRTRADEAAGRAESLIYGIFNDLTTSQYVGLNAYVTILHDLTVESGILTLGEAVAPTGESGYGSIYVDNSDGKLYFVDESGTAIDLTSGGGGTPGGLDGQVQYNSSDTFSGDGDFIYDGAGTVTIGVDLLVPQIGIIGDDDLISLSDTQLTVNGELYVAGTGHSGLTDQGFHVYTTSKPIPGGGNRYTTNLSATDDVGDYTNIEVYSEIIDFIYSTAGGTGFSITSALTGTMVQIGTSISIGDGSALVNLSGDVRIDGIGIGAFGSGGNTNYGFGSLVFASILTGQSNIAWGSSALTDLRDGVSNLGFGHLAGSQLTTGDKNTFIGNNTGIQTITGSGNIAVGYGAGAYNTDSYRFYVDSYWTDRGLNSTAMRSGSLMYGEMSLTIANQMLRINAYVQLPEITAPSNTADYGTIYVSSVDNNIHFVDSAGTDYDLTSSGGTPGGSTTQVQYNSGGSFAGDVNFTYDGSGTLTASTLVRTAKIGSVTWSDTGYIQFLSSSMRFFEGGSEQFEISSTEITLQNVIHLRYSADVFGAIFLDNFESGSSNYTGYQITRDTTTPQKWVLMANDTSISLYDITGNDYIFRSYINGRLELYADGFERLQIDTVITSYTDVVPGTDNAYDLGSSLLQWNEAHIVTIYENGTALSSKYAVTSHTHSASDITEISALTAIEGSQLENIDSVTITNTQWGYLGALNQGLTTTSAVTFTSASVTDLYVADQVIHTGDTDTYMQFSAADTWRVVTGNAQRILVNNSYIEANVNLRLAGASNYAEVQYNETAESIDFVFP